VSTARIFDASGDVVGAGFVIGPGQIATCAHVVTAALGGSPEDAVAPTGRVSVDLPLLASPHASDAVVRTWHPIDRTTGVGDVAILELSAEPPVAARVPPLHRPDRPWGHRFRVLGFPAGMQDGVWSAGELRDRQGTRWLQLQSDPHSPPVAQGFSGAPVWDEEVEAVVGMTVASDVRPDSTTAYLLPIEDVFGVDPGLLPNPYRGLEPFGEEHADVFYGRDDEVARLEALVDRRPLVAVVGRSGTGKSSLVRAGLLPRLRRRGGRIVELRPGPADEPPSVMLDRLAATLADPAADEPHGGVLLFADQFEELVGAGPASEGPTPAQDVLGQLVDMVRSAPLRSDGAASLRVVLTLRWEAMNELLTGDVVETFEHGTFSLAAMSRDQLRRAIVGPTARAPGLEFDPGLVERILDDAVAEPGQLPLVESLLTQLWESRRGGTLETAAYEQLGGVRGAVARHAEHAVGQLTSTDDDAGRRRLLTTLARPDDGAGFVRRAVRLEGLSADQQQIVESLARSRLLVVGQQADGDHTVELAHQALIDHWPRLRRWLDEDRDFLLWEHEVDRQRQAWDGAGRDHGALLRGVALARAKDWLERRGDDVPPPERAFVEASRRRERGEARRRRAWLSASAIVLALVLVLGTTLVNQRRDARREAAISASRSLATLSAGTAGIDPALSMMQALAAYERHPTPEAEQRLFQLYLGYRPVDAVLSGAQGDIVDVEASRDGRVIAALTSAGRVTVWVRQPGRPVTTRHLAPVARGGVGVTSIGVAPDGEGILLVESSRAWYYEVATGERRWEFPVDGEVEAAVLRDDGAAVLLMPAGNSDRLELWEPRGDGARLVAELTTRSGLGLGLGGFGSRDDTVVVRTVDFLSEYGDTDSRLQLWHPSTGELTTVATDVGGQGLDPNGRFLAACHGSTEGDSLELIDLRDGVERTFDLPDKTDCGTASTVIDPSGEVIVTSNGSLLIDARTGEMTVQPPPVSDGTPLGGGDGPLVLVEAMWSDGNQYEVLASDATRLVVTEVSTDDDVLVGMQGDPDQAADLPAFGRSLRLTPDGDHVVAVLDGGRRVVVSRTPQRGVDFRTVATADRPAPHRQPGPDDLAIDPDGTLLADRVAADLVQIRRLPGLELVSEISTAPAPEGDPDEAGTAAFVGFAGDLLLTSDGTRLERWNPGTGELLSELDLVREGIVTAGEVDGLAISPLPDPTRVAVVDEAHEDVRVLDAVTGSVVDTIPVGQDVHGVRFQADGPYLALQRRGGFLEVWDAEQRERVVGPLAVPERRPAPGGLGLSFEPPDTAVVDGFLSEPGSFFTGVGATRSHGVQLRWYRAGAATPERALDLGAPGDVIYSGPQPVSVSADGNVMLLAVEASSALPVAPQTVALDLRPEAWQEAVCRWIERRQFTDDELATMPDGTGSLTLC
jgi:WD40 repeat protein